MKKIHTVIILAIAGAIALVDAFHANAQGTWTQKADFGGTPRMFAVGFSIGNKGYIGTGGNCNFGCNGKDFWEWNQATNVWTQKADFGGGARSGAIGFSIGTKGYIGTGTDSTGNGSKGFWEWNQLTNTWTKKADFGGTARYGATGFSIGNKGYIGTGTDNVGANKQDFWEWDQTTNTWAQKTDFGGGPGYLSVGFSIGAKGYIGLDSTNNYFWEWDQASNVWTQKADFGGTARKSAVGFSIGTKGYVGTGRDKYNDTKDFWEWDQATNTWTQKADFGGTAREGAIGFSIGNKGYISTGSNQYAGVQDFWEFYNINISAVMVGNPICSNQCNGSASANASGGAPPFTYLWNTTPIQTTSTATGLCAGTHTVTISDSLGGTTATVTITAIPSPVTPSICMVTTDSATNYFYNVICWDKTLYNHVDSFIVYRKDAISSNYLRIGAVSENSLSEFVDTAFSIGGPNGGNPQYSSWLYKLAIRDSCGIIGAKGPYHQSMFVQRNNSNFSWNAYSVESGQTNPVAGYSFLRDDSNTGNWHVLVNTNGLSTTDPNYANYPNGNWRIDALGFNCTPTTKQYLKSHSNTTKPTVLGIDQLTLNSELIKIYPNPTIGVFTIQANNYQLIANSSIEIYNVMGERIYQHIGTPAGLQINVSEVPNGVYFLQLKTSEGIAVKKIVISK